jgi:hypothetical protein
LPMAGLRHTGVAAATARTHYTRADQAQDGSLTWLGTAGGTKNALTFTSSPSFASLVAGQEFRGLVGASANDGAVTIAVNGIAAAALLKPGAAGATALVGGELQPGQAITFAYDGTQFLLTSPVSLADTSTFARAHGQCRLTLSSGNLKLAPWNGNKLVIDGQMQTVPSAGVTLAPTGTTVGTLYYIYAYMNSGTMTLEASTTGHSTDSTTGVEIKTGDATRTLVGMAQPTTGPAWVQSSGSGGTWYVRSWFNRQVDLPLITGSASGGLAANTNTSVSGNLTLATLFWAGERGTYQITGDITPITAASAWRFQTAMDGGAVTSIGVTAPNSSYGINISHAMVRAPSEGAHTFSLLYTTTDGGTISVAAFLGVA